MKTCSRCGQSKPLAQFGADKRRKDGRQSQCNPCRAKVATQRYRADPDKHRLRQRTPRARNLHSAQVRKQAAILQAKVLAHYGEFCACCGSTEMLGIDHVNGNGREHRIELFGRPHASGIDFHRWLVKTGYPAGFQTLCQPCNSSKRRTDHCRIHCDCCERSSLTHAWRKK